MWTWDSGQITHDQTCWTYDSHDGCQVVSLAGGSAQEPLLYKFRRKKDDQDMLDILTMIVTGIK